MRSLAKVIEIDIDGCSFTVRPVGPDVLKSSHMVAASLDKQLAWAVGFFLGNTELSQELWNVIAGIARFYDRGRHHPHL